MKMTMMMMVMLRKFRIFAHETGNQTLFKPRFFFCFTFQFSWNYHGACHLGRSKKKTRMTWMTERPTNLLIIIIIHSFGWWYFFVYYERKISTHTHTPNTCVYEKFYWKKNQREIKPKTFNTHTHIPDIQSKSKNFRIFIYFVVVVIVHHLIDLLLLLLFMDSMNKNIPLVEFWRKILVIIIIIIIIINNNHDDDDDSCGLNLFFNGQPPLLPPLLLLRILYFRYYF